MKLKTQTQAPLQELATSLEGQRVAMLTLNDQQGQLVSQPMTPQEMDETGALWMMVSQGNTADRVGPGGADGNLSFSDERRASYVSISGRVTLVDDLERKRALWSIMARPWFPGGPEDPTLLLLRLEPRQAELWEGPGSGVVRSLAFAASVTAGRPVGLGQHRTLPLDQAASGPPR